jgi:hypothetical protein
VKFFFLSQRRKDRKEKTSFARAVFWLEVTQSTALPTPGLFGRVYEGVMAIGIARASFPLFRIHCTYD